MKGRFSNNSRELLGLAFFVLGLVVSYPHYSFADDTPTCKIKAYNLEKGDYDSHIPALSQSAVSTKTWEDCYDRATKIATQFGNLWDDTDSKFEIEDRHIYFYWLWFGSTSKAQGQWGYVNKYTPKIVSKKSTGNQIYSAKGTLITDK